MRKHTTILIIALLTATSSVANAQDADTLRLQNDSVTWNESLEDINVVASSVHTVGDKTTALITKEMRRGARNTAQMLGNIRGLTWNAVDNSVEYNGKHNIIVLVDSLEKGYNYVMNLHHVRFEKVEIVDQPKGKYEGYDALINLVTQKNYEGYEGHLRASTRLMPAGPNAGKFLWFVNNGSITYTKNRWNFVADAIRMSDNKNVLQQWYEHTYPVQGLTERVVHDEETNEKLLENQDYQINVSVDYQFNKNHSLSWAYVYDYNLDKNQLSYQLEQWNMNIDLIDTLDIHSQNDTYNHNHSTALFYRGRLGNWNYDADINYVYNRNTPDNTFHRGELFTLRNHYNDHMHFTRFRSEARHNWHENRLQLRFGYNNTWKDYERCDYESRQHLNSNGFMRNGAWFNLWGRLDSIGHNTASIGGRTEHIHVRSNGVGENQLVWSVSAMYWHKLTEKNWIRINYDYSISHPNQSQTSGHGYFTDSLSWSGGNPFLQPSVSHQWKVWFDAWWCFNAQAGITYAPNTITGISELRHGLLPSGIEGDYVASTFVNSRYLSPWVSVSFTKRFAKDFVYKADALLALPSAKYEDFRQRGKEFSFKTSLQYYSRKYKLTTYLSYELNDNKLVTPQTYSTNCKDDLLYLSIDKTFFHDRLSLNFLVISPVKWGNGIEKTCVVSPAIQSTNYFNSWKSNNRGALQLTLVYRFMGGKSVREYEREMSEER